MTSSTYRTKSSTFLFASLTSALALASVPASASSLTVIKNLCYSGTSCTGSGGTAGGQGIIPDGSGNYFGLTSGGGVYGHGQAFKLKKGSGGTYSYVPIYDFCPSSGCADGSIPTGKLIIDTNGNLYGVTAYGGSCSPDANGCGTIFELSPSGVGTTYNLTTLYTFCSTGSTCGDGRNPEGELTYVGDPSSAYDGSSTLFGVTTVGGANTKGTVFKLTGVGGTPSESVIYDFCPSSGCADGATPKSLIADGSGNLFGNTALGGADGDGDGTNNGVVFELSPSGGSYTQTVLWTFCATTGCTDGITPNNQLVISNTGKLFGTTTWGGANGYGTVFRVTPNGTSSTESVRYSFCSTGGAACTDGANPDGGIVMDSNGDFIGVTPFGGNRFLPGGTIFKLSGTTLTTLYSFCSAGTPCSTDGNLPQATVAVDSSGNVFGTNDNGGSHGGGVVFEFTP